jgi:hypothetical protein
MASKSKDVRIEQLRVFEKKLALRLQQLDKKGISKEKAQSDPFVKSLKSKIRETNVRIAAFDKFVQRNQELAQAKAQKLVELATKKEEKAPAPAKESSTEAKQAEAKPKKKAAETEKEPKKQPAAKDEAPVKEPKKQATATEEAAPKKTKKQPAAADETAPKKKAAKKKEE